jgi:hypothetical protein
VLSQKDIPFDRNRTENHGDHITKLSIVPFKKPTSPN